MDYSLKLILITSGILLALFLLIALFLKKKHRLLFSGLYLIVLLAILMSFHFVLIEGRTHIIAKENLSFERTVITQKDINKICDFYNGSNFITQSINKNDYLIKRLLEKEVIYEKE